MALGGHNPEQSPVEQAGGGVGGREVGVRREGRGGETRRAEPEGGEGAGWERIT